MTDPMLVVVSFCKTLALCILSVLATFLVPVVYILLVPVLFYRCVISRIGPVLRPTLRSVLEPISACFAKSGVYTNPTHGITVVIACDASLSVETLQDLFRMNVLNLKDAEGNLVYPELQQKVTSWMGYFFWEQLTDFRLNDYIREYGNYSREGLAFGSGPESQQQEREFFLPLVLDFVQQCFRVNKSPWEILLLGKDKMASTKSYLIFRFHHALSDGFRAGILIKRLFSDHPEIIPQPPKPRIIDGIPRFLNSVIKLFILGPAMMTLNIPQSVDHNEWTSTKDLDPTDPTFNFFVTHLLLKSLKDVKNLHKSTLEALLLTCFTGAVRIGMMEAGLKLPPKLHCLLPSLVTSNSDATMKLGNYTTFLTVELPIHEVDPLKRLDMVNNRLKSVKRLGMGEILWMYINLFCKVPSVLLGNQLKHRGPTTMFPNINLNLGSDVDKEQLHVLDIRPVIVGGRILPGVGSCCIAVGYGDNLQVWVGGHQQVISKNVMQKMEIQFAADLSQLEQFTLA